MSVPYCLENEGSGDLARKCFRCELAAWTVAPVVFALGIPLGCRFGCSEPVSIVLCAAVAVWLNVRYLRRSAALRAQSVRRDLDRAV